MSGDAKHEIYTRRGARNRVVLLALVGFVALLFVATIARLGENAGHHPFKEFWSPTQSDGGSDAKQ